eukprot:992462-Amphidinium_carterae.2
MALISQYCRTPAVNPTVNARCALHACALHWRPQGGPPTCQTYCTQPSQARVKVQAEEVSTRKWKHAALRQMQSRSSCSLIIISDHLSYSMIRPACKPRHGPLEMSLQGQTLSCLLEKRQPPGSVSSVP